MPRVRNLNKHRINQVYSMKIIGKGKHGNFFGKIEKIICFIKKEKRLKYNQIVSVKVTNATSNYLIGELI